MKHKLYIVTRKDLTKSQQAVQAGHALAEYLLKNNTTWDNGTLVYLSVPNKDILNYLTLRLKQDNISYTKFREPDLGDELTAIASLGSNRHFKYLKLL